MVGVRRGTGRIRTGPIEGLVGQRSDGERKGGRGGRERKGAGSVRGQSGRVSGPEDRPSKLSHALSVLRKRRIGVVLRCRRRRAARRESRREGLKTTIGP